MIQVTHRFFASPQSSQPPTPSQPRTNREPTAQTAASREPRQTAADPSRAPPGDPRPATRRPCTSTARQPPARMRTSEPRSTNGVPWNASDLRTSSASRGSSPTRPPPSVAPSAAPQRRHARRMLAKERPRSQFCHLSSDHRARRGQDRTREYIGPRRAHEQDAAP